MVRGVPPARIEKEMVAAAPEVRWTMNMCLAEIGIHFPKTPQAGARYR